MLCIRFYSMLLVFHMIVGGVTASSHGLRGGQPVSSAVVSGPGPVLPTALQTATDQQRLERLAKQQWSASAVPGGVTDARQEELALRAQLLQANAVHAARMQLFRRFGNSPPSAVSTGPSADLPVTQTATQSPRNLLRISELCEQARSLLDQANAPSDAADEVAKTLRRHAQTLHILCHRAESQLRSARSDLDASNDAIKNAWEEVYALARDIANVRDDSLAGAFQEVGAVNSRHREVHAALSRQPALSRDFNVLVQADAEANGRRFVNHLVHLSAWTGESASGSSGSAAVVASRIVQSVATQAFEAFISKSATSLFNTSGDCFFRRVAGILDMIPQTQGGVLGEVRAAARAVHAHPGANEKQQLQVKLGSLEFIPGLSASKRLAWRKLMEAIDSHEVNGFIASSAGLEEHPMISAIINLLYTAKTARNGVSASEKTPASIQHYQGIVASLTLNLLKDETELATSLESVVHDPVAVAQKIRSLIAADIEQISSINRFV